MADVKNLADLCLREATVLPDIRNLIAQIRPDWKSDELRITELGGGVSCLLYRCYSTDLPHESVTVRMWKMFEKTPYANHLFEVQVIQEATKHGLFPTLLATFANGYCYSYVPGKSMFTNNAMHFHVNEAIISLVATNMASIHSLQVRGVDVTKSTFFQPMLDSLDQAPFPLMKPSPSVEIWRKEVLVLEEFLSKQELQLCICHGDPHPGNIIWREDKDDVMFLDWEFAHVGYALVDIAYFIESFEYKECVCKTKILYEAEFESLFAKYYLRRYFDLNGKQVHEVHEQDISELVKKIGIFRLGVWMRFIIHHICFPDISRIATTDVEATLEYFIKRYQTIRQEVMGSPCLGQTCESL